MNGHYRLDVVSEDLVADYLDGISIAQLSREHNVSGKTIRRRLQREGVPLRGLLGRDGQPLPMPIGARGRKVPLTDEAMAKRALANQQSLARVGRDEMLLVKLLQERGAEVTPQQAVGPFNLDIGWAPLAIELHSDAHYPLTRRIIPERVRFLREEGWLPIYIWMLRDHSISAALVDELVRYRDEVMAVGDWSDYETRVVRFNGRDAVKFQKRF